MRSLSAVSEAPTRVKIYRSDIYVVCLHSFRLPAICGAVDPWGHRSGAMDSIACARVRTGSIRPDVNRPRSCAENATRNREVGGTGPNETQLHVVAHHPSFQGPTAELTPP